MLLRGEPSMVERALTSNRYLLSTFSHCSLLSSGPVYSTMNLPFLIGSVANAPSPVRERPTRNGYFAPLIRFFLDDAMRKLLWNRLAGFPSRAPDCGQYRAS